MVLNVPAHTGQHDQVHNGARIGSDMKLKMKNTLIYCSKSILNFFDGHRRMAIQETGLKKFAAAASTESPVPGRAHRASEIVRKFWIYTH